jgi:hypothetical protein
VSVARLLRGGNELQDFLSGLPNVKNLILGFGALRTLEVGNVWKWLADEDERPMMEMCSLFRTKLSKAIGQRADFVGRKPFRKPDD